MNLEVIVKQDARIEDLKKACKLAFLSKNEKERKKNEPVKSFNWRYFWRNFGFVFSNEKLDDKDKRKELRAYGIKNISVLEFYRLTAKDKNLKSGRTKTQKLK
jgi:hypothetical protein